MVATLARPVVLRSMDGIPDELEGRRDLPGVEILEQAEDHAGPRIMLADDDKGFREMLRDLLSDEGFEIVGEAADGAEAVEMAPRVSPDVVFMDLRMPEVDGIEATRLVKALLPQAQVIILSAYEDPGLQRGAEQAGVYCYLIKGCPPQMIRDMLSFAWNYKLGLEERDHGPNRDPARTGAPSEGAPTGGDLPPAGLGAEGAASKGP